MTSLAHFTRREEEIYRIVVEEGISRKDIADRLGIGLYTVINHMRALLNKTGADSQLQMAVWHYTKARTK